MTAVHCMAMQDGIDGVGLSDYVGSLCHPGELLGISSSKTQPGILSCAESRVGC